jgi:ABC-type transport system substrate-binding protein
MHRRKLWLFAGVVLAALALAATGSARVSGPDGASAKSAGTLVFGAEQGGGPDWCLNLILDVDCNAFWNVVFQTPVIRGAFIFTPKFTYAPDLITHYKFQTSPQRVTFYLRKNAKWSDGVPVTGKDWKFTWQTAVNPKYKDHIDPLGWQDIKSVTGNKYVVKVTFKRNFAPWRGLFNYVLPQHALAGTDMLTVWNDCICNPKKGNAPIGDGPFLLTKFDRGAGITLQRNTRGWYGPKAKLDSIVFRFITNTNSEIQAIRSGEVDAIYPQPQLALADLRNQAGLRIQTHVGLQYEHIEIEQGAHGNPLAKQTFDFASTQGNALRTLAFTIFQDQAAKAGIELRNGFVPAGTLFGSKLPAHDFDLAMFTQLVTVDPHYVVTNFTCGNASNYTEYCNRNVTRWLQQSDRELNDAKRLVLVKKVGKVLANDVPMIPLFQRPTYFVYKTSLGGLVDNPTSQGPTWNVEKWTKK